MKKEPIPYFDLRVLAEYDTNYKTYVAHCLQTGSVTTADDMDTVLDMIKELLEEELVHAIKYSNYGNLFSSPAPPEVWKKWRTVAQQQEVESLELDIKAEGISLDDTETATTVEPVEVVRAA